MKKKCLLLMLSIILSLTGLLIPIHVNAENLELVVISPHWEGIQNEFEAAFNEYYMLTYGDNVDIEWIDVGGTSDDLKYIESNFVTNPNGIGIDVFFGGGIDPYIVLMDEDLLYPYQVNSNILDKIPQTIAGIPMYDEEYRWYGAALSGFGIIYNRQLLALESLPEPTTWEDLINPELLGWVSSADPRHSGSTHMAYEIILQAYGWEKGFEIITSMGANIRAFPESSSAVPKSVGASEVAYGLAIDFYAWSEVDKVGSENIGYVMPEGLSVINPDSIGILKGAPNFEVAQRFIEFVLSEKGQKLWLLPVGAEDGPKEFLLGRMSVVPELYATLGDKSIVPINPFDVKTSLDYDSNLGSLRYSFINDLIGSTIIDQHENLVEAWEAIIVAEEALDAVDKTSAKLTEAKEQLAEVPLTWAEAEIAIEEFDDAQKRNEYISEWHSFALIKYEDAKQLADDARLEAETEPEPEPEPEANPNITLYVITGVILLAGGVYYFVYRPRL